MTDYDRIHQYWLRAHAAGSPMKFVRHRVVLKELRGLKPGNTLDAGCGTGEYALFLARQGHTVSAFDPSPGAVALLRERCGGGSKVHVQVNTIEGFCAEQVFDNIVSVEVIEHLQHDREAIGKLFSLLKEGGTMVVTAPASPMLFSEVDRLSGHFRRYSYPRFWGLFGKAGFREVSIKRYGFPLLFLYALARKCFLDRFLIRRFSSVDSDSPRWGKRLSALFPVVLFLDMCNIPGLSVGYVATCRK